MSDPSVPPRAPRHGWRLWLSVAAGVIVGLPLLIAAVLLAALNTGPGQREAEHLAARFTGGMVQLTGLHGRVPDALRLDSLAVHDAHGVWLTAQGIVLDWSPLHLIGMDARVQTLSAASVALLRLPLSTKPAKPSAAASPGLPVAIDIDHLSISDLSVGAPVATIAAHLAATGSVHLQRLTRGTADLALRRTDAPGAYGLHAVMTDAAITAQLDLQEPARGLAGMAAHLPDLGALGLDATLTGPWSAAVLHLALAAGPLRAAAAGTLDLPQGGTDPAHGAADLAVTANAPAMTPAPGLSWQSLALALHLTGPFARPAADGTLDIATLAAGGSSIGHVAAKLTADTTVAGFTAQLTQVQLPPPNQGLLAAGPLSLHAQLRLDDPAHPITYGFEHPLLTGQGNAVLAPLLHARLDVALPDLQRLARPSGRDVDGHAGLTLLVARDARQATRIDLDAAMAVTGGAGAPPAIRGNTTIGATVTLDGANIDVSRLKLDGTNVHATATAARHGSQLSADWHIAAEDLHALAPQLKGAADLAGHLTGPQTDFAVTATLTGSIGTASLPPGPVSFALHATGLPDQPAGHIEGDATLAGAPLTLDVNATRDPAHTLHVAVHRADWRSARIAGDLALAQGAPLPTGSLTIAMPRLDDLRPLLGQPVSGSLNGTLDLPPARPGSIHLQARNAGLPGRASVGQAVLAATVSNPGSHPSVNATLTADDLHAGAIGGALRLTAAGPAEALALRLTATLHQLAGADAAIAAAATLNTAAHTLTLADLTTAWHAETLRLTAPARLTYAPGLSVDRLLLSASTPGASPATLAIAGSLTPALALTVDAGGLTPALARPFAPALDADGTLHLQARLAGTTAAPTGTIRLAATGLRARSGAARGLPAADLTATAALAGSSAQIDAQLAAGSSRATLRGTAPLATTGALALHTDATLDLALLDPILTPQGRRVRGAATLHASITGAPGAPSVAGSMTLANGEVQDYAQGIHITGMQAAIDASGQTIRITSVTGRAGGGSIALTGSVGLAAPMPVDLHLTASNARPITSDLVTATLDADLTVTGDAQRQLAARGRVHVRRADIQVPDQLPASVAVLTVRRPGDKPPPPPSGPGLQIPLDITLDAPQQIFVRGRGLDAELGGSLHVGGTAAAPQTSGGIELRRGTFSLAGTTLDFSSGDISFNGASKIDPALNLIATSSTSDLTATLTVGGYASAPKITLSSVPDRPQDEVLSALLFHQSAATLSPFQLAQIAAALAQVSGIGGGGPDPLSRLRKGLGLDRLSVGSGSTSPNPIGGGTGGSSTTTTSVEAGRYIAPGIYVGAKQGTSGAQTQAQVQIDITHGLKLDTDVGSGSGANTVGLTYQFQY